MIGNRRIPKETILARLFTHPGDTVDQLAVERDFNSLWNTGYFEDVRIEKEDTPKGNILNVYVREKPTIREINYKGMNPITQSDVLERFKKAKVGLSVESRVRSQQDQARRDSDQGIAGGTRSPVRHHQDRCKDDSAGFRLSELQYQGRPTVKVGKIQFQGNEHISSRELRASMKNLRPIGIPHSIFLENLFPRTTTPASWKKMPTGFAVRIATRATSARRSASRSPTSATKADSPC